MTNDLQADIAKVRVGDRVTVEVDYAGHTATISGEVWQPEYPSGSLSIGSDLIRYGDGNPAPRVRRVIEHVCPRRTIERGDVLESRADADRFEIPDRTLFRDRGGDSWEWPAGLIRAFRWAPLRCVDVPGNAE